MRIIRNIFLIAVFSVLAGSIALAFIAEMNFLAADRLIKTYRWKEALGLYETASSLDPLNTKYITAIGDFYLRRSAEKREQMAQFFEKAEPFYTLAAELNPRCAEYTITLGRIQTGLFLEDEKVYEDRLAPGLAYLIRSIRNDPNGYNTSFMAGYTVLPFWDSLSEDDRSVVEDKLRYVLEDRPWRGSDYIYPAIWKYTQDFDLIERVRPDKIGRASCRERV